MKNPCISKMCEEFSISPSALFRRKFVKRKQRTMINNIKNLKCNKKEERKKISISPAKFNIFYFAYYSLSLSFLHYLSREKYTLRGK